MPNSMTLQFEDDLVLAPLVRANIRGLWLTGDTVALGNVLALTDTIIQERDGVAVVRRAARTFADGGTVTMPVQDAPVLGERTPVGRVTRIVDGPEMIAEVTLDRSIFPTGGSTGERYRWPNLTPASVMREQILSDIETVMTQPVQIRAPQFQPAVRYSVGGAVLVRGRDPLELMREFREPWFVEDHGPTYVAAAEPEFTTTEVLAVRRALAREATPYNNVTVGRERCRCDICIQYRFERLRVCPAEHYDNHCDCAACHRLRVSILADLTRIPGPFEPSVAPLPVSRGDIHYQLTPDPRGSASESMLGRAIAWAPLRDVDDLAERVRAPSVPDGWKRNRFEA